jgi:glycosidase
MTLPAPRGTLLLLGLAAALTGCDSECLGDACPGVPDEPWDPDSTLTGDEDGYGYGSGGGSGGSGDDGGDDGTTEEEDDRVILTTRSCDVTVSHSPSGSPGTVAIAGEFNDWTPQTMTVGSDGAYTADLGVLDPGTYAFKYVYDGSFEGQPPINVYTKWVGDSENRALRVGDCTKPLLQASSAEATAGGTLSATIQVASAASGKAIDPASVRVTVGDRTVTPEIDADEGTITISESGLAPGKHSVRVWASDTDGVAAENNPLWVPLWVEDDAFEWEDGLLYFVFTDRFRNGDYGSEPWSPVAGVATTANYQGGDFQGVIDAIEAGYFDALGVNAIWLSPVYDNPEGAYAGVSDGRMYTGYHGYWPIDSLGIENRWGDAGASGEDRLKQLVDVAHEHGIRIVFDLVLNHVHEDHSYTTEHPEWFTGGCVCGAPGCGWEEKPVECWFTGYLPDLSYKNHDITERVLADTLALLADYDVDGIRVDAAKHMDHVIMRSLRKRLDEVEAEGGAEFWAVGETFTSDRGLIMNYVGDHELHGQFDFPLYYAIRGAFTGGGGSFRDLHDQVGWSRDTYGGALDAMSPFLGNHDIERFATAVTGVAGDPWSGWLEDPMAEGGSSVTQWDLINKASMAFAFTLTQPGVPLIYYGDEIGLHGGGDPDNRRFMSFDPYLSANQETLLARVQAIGQVRKDSTAIRRGDASELWLEDDLYIYAIDNGGGDVAIVAMNKGSSSRTVSVDLSAHGVDGATFTDGLGSSVGGTVSGNSLSISLNSWQYAILVRP